MQKKPLVSVVIPVYNSKYTIDRAIESIRSQSYRPIEVILVDDASEKAISDFIKINNSSDFQIKILRNKFNLWVSVSRNRGIKESLWEYIAFLDSDDYWIYDLKIEKQIEYLESKILVVAVWCSWLLNWRKIFAPVSYRNFLKIAPFKMPFHIGTLCVRKNILLKEKIFFSNKWCEDYFFLLHLWTIGIVKGLNFQGLSYNCNLSGRYMSNVIKCNFECINTIFIFRRFYSLWFLAIFYRILKMFLKLPLWLIRKIR